MLKRLFFVALLALPLSVPWSDAVGSEVEDLTEGYVKPMHLAQMGLTPLRVMSDAEGRQVRGRAVIHGVPGKGFFVTDVNQNALDHSKLGEGMPGRVLHKYGTSGSTVIVFHPKHGVKMSGKK